jgi:predicted AlkP superfamily phosphohydrolase/phosphomutase
MASSSRRILLISLDGATWDVLHPLMRQGYMPHLARLTSEGAQAELESVVPAVTAPAWTSFMTGKIPSKHGIFHFTRFDPSDYTSKINNSGHIRSKTIWQILSEKGKRVAAINVPYTYPPSPVNGIMVAGWDAPPGKSFTYPQELSEEILRDFPDYASNLDLPLSSNRPTDSQASFERFTSKLVRGVEQGTALSLKLLGRESWDVFMIHFQQTDWIQHNLWGLIEAACGDPRNKSDWVERVRLCYRSFDRCIGQLLAELEGQDVIKIILSDHGFGRHLGDVFPNYFLNQWGYLYPTVARNGHARLKARLRNSSFKFVRMLYDVLSSAKGALTPRNETRFASFEDYATKGRVPRAVDWTRTRAAMTSGSMTAFVFVNLKGRTLHGTVEPGAEYESIVADIMARFREVRNLKTGEPLFTAVARGSETYPAIGEGIEVPDIVLTPVEGYWPEYELCSASPEPSERGQHRTLGVLVVAGDDLKRDFNSHRPRLIDIAPTILHSLALPIPEDMDGRVLTELFPTPQSIRYEIVPRVLNSAPRAEYNPEEAAVIEQRLRNLGYIG